MITNLLNNEKKVFAVSAMLSAFTAIISPYYLVGIFLIIFFLLLQVYALKDLALLFLFSLLVISSDISEILRTIVDTGAIIFLFYLFIRNHGLNFNSYPRLPQYVFYFVIFVIASMIFSSLFSGYIIRGFESTARQILFFAIWYIFFSNINEEKDIFKYIWTFVAAGAVIGITIVVSFAISEASFIELFSEGILHEGGSFKNVAAAGGIFAVTIPLTFTLSLYYSEKTALKWLASIFILIQISGLFFTNSRAAIIAVIVSTVIILFIHRRKLFYKIILSSILLFSLSYFILPAFTELVDVYFRTGRILQNTRYYMWDMSYSIIADNPIWGTGPGQFKAHMYSHIPVMLQTWEAGRIGWLYEASGMGESHNFILFRTAELGIMGFFSAVLLPVIFLFFTVKTMKIYKENKKIFYIVTGIFALAIGLFVRSFFEATGLLSHGWIIRDLPFWICFAIIIYLYKNRESILPDNR